MINKYNCGFIYRVCNGGRLLIYLIKTQCRSLVHRNALFQGHTVSRTVSLWPLDVERFYCRRLNALDSCFAHSLNSLLLQGSYSRCTAKPADDCRVLLINRCSVTGRCRMKGLQAVSTDARYKAAIHVVQWREQCLKSNSWDKGRIQCQANRVAR